MPSDVLYHIFFELNIGYAGVEPFSLAINRQMLKIVGLGRNDILGDRTNRVISKCVAGGVQMHATIQNEIQQTSAAYSSILKECEFIFARQSKFVHGFKAMFVNSALYCLSVLLLFFHEDYFTICKNIYVILTFLTVTIVFNIIIFIRSFTEKGLDEENSISWIIPAISYVVVFALSFMFCYRCPMALQSIEILPEHTILDISLLMAISPYLLHLLRAFSIALMLMWYKYIHSKPFKPKLKLIKKYVHATYANMESKKMEKELIKKLLK